MNHWFISNFQKTQKSSNLASMKSCRPHPGADTLNFRDASIGLGPGGVGAQKSQKFEIQKIYEILENLIFEGGSTPLWERVCPPPVP